MHWFDIKVRYFNLNKLLLALKEIGVFFKCICLKRSFTYFALSVEICYLFSFRIQVI